MPMAVLSLNGAPQLELSVRSDDVDVDASGGDTSSPSLAGAATQRVMHLLGSVLRIKITDGRVVVGKFHCFDKHQNIILTDTREYLALQRTTGASSNGKKGGHKPPKREEDEREEEAQALWKTGTSRSLGMALVPGKHIVYVKVERTTATAGRE